MNTQVVRPRAPRRRTSDAWRPVAMAAVLLLVLVLAALAAAWLTDPGGFLLTVERPTGGSLVGEGVECGSGGSDCTTSGTDGQVIEVRAVADEGYQFAGYTGDCAPIGRFLMDGPRTCGARFDRVSGLSTSTGSAAATGRRWPLILTPPANGTIVTLEGHQCGTAGQVCSVDVPEGHVVSLDVQADEGYRVQAYTGDCALDGTANMTQARTCGVVLVRGQGPANVPAGAASRPKAEPAPGGIARTGSPSPASGGPTGGTATAPGGGTGPSPGAVGLPPSAESTGPRPPGSGAVIPSSPPTSPPTGPTAQGGDPEEAQKIARADIAAVLEAYRAAYQRMDIPAMQRIQPELNVRLHKLQFGDTKSVKYTFGGEPKVERLDVERGEARAVVDLKTENDLKAGTLQKLEGKATYLLKRIGETKDWQIIQIVYEMK